MNKELFSYIHDNLLPQEVDRLQYCSNTKSKIKDTYQKPFRESSSYTRYEEYWWDDGFKKSSNKYYKQGRKYATRVLLSNIGNNVNGLVYKLKNQKKYKHKSFKQAIKNYTEELINRPNIEVNAYTSHDCVCLNYKNIVCNISDFKKERKYNYLVNNSIEDHDYKYSNDITIGRRKGIYYFIICKYPEYFEQYFEQKLQLNRKELKYYKLENLPEEL